LVKITQTVGDEKLSTYFGGNRLRIHGKTGEIILNGTHGREMKDFISQKISHEMPDYLDLESIFGLEHRMPL